MGFIRMLMGGIMGGLAVAGATALWIAHYPPEMLGGGNANVKWMFSDLEQRMETVKKQSEATAGKCDVASNAVQQLIATLAAQSTVDRHPQAVEPTPANVTEKDGPTGDGDGDGATETGSSDDLDWHDIKVQKIEHGIAFMTIDGNPTKVTTGVNVMGIEAIVDVGSGVVTIGDREFHVAKCQKGGAQCN